eukprot:CAMPEP_0117507422 /NCGR_PEP_ID=MMETSP0784-20121206/26414_1 /TAXON_ID=39447 /ORGANISM="" /LENGTH=508 /DNA_ID=CAMNT_0005302923 /DNA_START=104 /DNA_END=1630 /DNA_ORIENTATION=+
MYANGVHAREATHSSVPTVATDTTDAESGAIQAGVLPGAFACARSVWAWVVFGSAGEDVLAAAPSATDTIASSATAIQATLGTLAGVLMTITSEVHEATVLLASPLVAIALDSGPGETRAVAPSSPSAPVAKKRTAGAAGNARTAWNRVCSCSEGLGIWIRRALGRKAGAAGAPAGVDDRDLRRVELQEQSRAAMERHLSEVADHPTVLMYDASSSNPATCCSSSGVPTARDAYLCPLNATRASRIENESFEGSFVFIYCSGEDNQAAKARNPYQSYFDNKTRRWEARLQGKFRKRPVGALYAGCCLQDFDYSIDYSWAAAMLASAVLPVFEAVTGERFYFSWGARGKAAEEVDSEVGTVVTGATGFDQVIVTPADETPPDIRGEISQFGVRRNAMGTSTYRSIIHRIVEELNTESTYTFCIWGCSRYIDVKKSAFVNLIPGAWSYAGLLDQWPAHFVFYALENDDADPRHLERRKKYFMDFMVWSSDMSTPLLPLRYNFKDARSVEE